METTPEEVNESECTIEILDKGIDGDVERGICCAAPMLPFRDIG